MTSQALRTWIERHAIFGATAAVCLTLYLAASVSYEGFFSFRVFSGFFADNAVLGIVAVGVTLVILNGGIDLSVGAVAGCSSIMIASLIETGGWPPVLAMALAIGSGTALGAFMGVLIARFELPPFIVTLAGMFFARGMAFIISQEPITVEHVVVRDMQAFPLEMARWIGVAGLFDSQLLLTTTLLFVIVLTAGVYVANWTRFGRNVYAVGGNENAARLMGLPVGATKVRAYACSGCCAALAGAVHVLYTFSGDARTGAMLELDAIAAVVIGGTLLSGGIGSVIGSALGVMILAVIQTALIFEGRLSPWWSRIMAGVLLLGFMLLQRALQRRVS